MSVSLSAARAGDRRGSRSRAARCGSGGVDRGGAQAGTTAADAPRRRSVAPGRSRSRWLYRLRRTRRRRRGQRRDRSCSKLARLDREYRVAAACGATGGRHGLGVRVRPTPPEHRVRGNRRQQQHQEPRLQVDRRRSTLAVGLRARLDLARRARQRPKAPGTLYASASTGIYKTTDGSRTWQTYSRGLLPAKGEGWGRLAVDPNKATSSMRALAAVCTRASTQDTTGKRSPGPRDDRLGPIAATRPTTIAATTFSKWHRIGRRWIHWLGLDSSTDGGKTWRAARLHVGLKTNAPYDFAADPRLPTTLYVAVQAGIFMSTDAGRSWRTIEHGLPQDSDATSLAADAGTLYAGVGKEGMYQTTDAGQTWTHSGRNPVPHRDSASQSRDGPGTPDHRARLRRQPIWPSDRHAGPCAARTAGGLGHRTINST